MPTSLRAHGARNRNIQRPPGRFPARRIAAWTSTAALATMGTIAVTSPAHAAEETVTFTDPAGETWTVPDGVSEVDVTMVGASGGGGEILRIPGTPIEVTGDGAPGLGDVITATMPVTAGDELTFHGSGRGGDVGSRHSPGSGGKGYSKGGDGDTGSLAGKAGGGGGGASAVLLNGDVMIVAGGGGGGGGRGAGFADCHGGSGGHAEQDGLDAWGVCSGGGSGGPGSDPERTGGHGSDGGNAGTSTSGGGGGGGGGGYQFPGRGGGGGMTGGGGGGGGGGGASYAASDVDVNNLTIDDSQRAGFVELTFDPTFETSVEVTPSQESILTGQGIDVQVDVANDTTSDTPTGSVTLSDGDTNLGTATLHEGTAVFTGITPELAADGPSPDEHELTAEYHADDELFNGSTGSSTIEISPGETTTSLQVHPTSGVYGQQVEARALVQPVSPASGEITGGVFFIIDDGVVAAESIEDGEASADIPMEFIGQDDLTAVFAGSDAFNSSESVAQAIDISEAISTLEVSTSPDASVAGEPVALTADLGTEDPGQAPVDGTVQFALDGEDYGDPVEVTDEDADLDGVATLDDVDDLDVGEHEITADYSGNDTRSDATSEAITHEVAKADVTVDLEAEEDTPTDYGSSVELHADIGVDDPGAATVDGEVEFFDGDTSLGSADATPTTSAATLVVDDLDVGNHDLTAVYSGNDALNEGESDALAWDVVESEVSVDVGLDPSPSVFGEDVDVSATVSPSDEDDLTPTGQVQFNLDGEPWGDPVDLASAGATMTASDLPVGDAEISASYLGNDGYLPADSDPVDHEVTAGEVTVDAVTEENPVTEGEQVNITATVDSDDPAHGTPEGTVSFRIDGTEHEADLADGQATWTSTDLAVGEHSVIAHYTGSEEFHPGDSDELTQEVVAAASDGSDNASSDDSGTGDTGDADSSGSDGGTGADDGTDADGGTGTAGTSHGSSAAGGSSHGTSSGSGSMPSTGSSVDSVAGLVGLAVLALLGGVLLRQRRSHSARG